MAAEKVLELPLPWQMAAVIKVEQPHKVSQLKTDPKQTGTGRTIAEPFVDSNGNTWIFGPTGARFFFLVDDHNVVINEHSPKDGHDGNVCIEVDGGWPQYERTPEAVVDVNGLEDVTVLYMGGTLRNEQYRKQLTDLGLEETTLE